MVETSSDQTKAFLYALGVHVFAAVVMFAGLLFSTAPKTVVPKGVIDAVWVDMSVGRPLPKPVKPVERKPPPPKPVAKPEPAPPPPPPDATLDDVTDQVPLPPPVPDQEALNFERQREELRKQQEAARTQQELEKQRMQQLADIRAQRAQAQAEREKQEQLLADVQEQRADPPPEPEPEGAQRPGADVEDDLLSQYVGLIQEVVTQNWRRPANTPPGIRCKLLVRQIPGGEVIGVQVSAPCNADPLIQESIKDAVERASPLPYDGFDSVFQSSLIFNFEYDG